MTYKYMTLTESESMDGACLGWGYISKNKSRWKTAPIFKEQLETYDRGVSSIVIDDVLYQIYRDITIVSEDTRLYILRNMQHDTDMK